MRDAIQKIGGQLPDTPSMWSGEDRADVAEWLRNPSWQSSQSGYTTRRRGISAAYLRRKRSAFRRVTSSAEGDLAVWEPRVQPVSQKIFGGHHRVDPANRTHRCDLPGHRARMMPERRRACANNPANRPPPNAGPDNAYSANRKVLGIGSAMCTVCLPRGRRRSDGRTGNDMNRVRRATVGLAGAAALLSVGFMALPREPPMPTTAVGVLHNTGARGSNPCPRPETTSPTH